MRIVTVILRILFGAIFLIFGLNGFMHVIPNMPMSDAPMPDAAVSFFTAMGATGYMLPLLFASQVVAGVLIVSGVFTPLGLVMIAPVLVNIALFHAFLAPGGLGLAIILAMIWAFLVCVCMDWINQGSRSR